MRVSLVKSPIDIAEIVKAVAHPDHGAIATFLGVVRQFNDGRPVTGIDYSAYDAMAEREMQRIAGEAAEKFGTDSIAIEHRTGHLAVGEASVVIVVSHERRRPALDAVALILEELKSRVPIWKCEHYADGTREWVHAATSASASQ